MDFLKFKKADQMYFYINSWCSAGGILEPGTVFFINLILAPGSGSRIQNTV